MKMASSRGSRCLNTFAVGGVRFSLELDASLSSENSWSSLASVPGRFFLKRPSIQLETDRPGVEARSSHALNCFGHR